MSNGRMIGGDSLNEAMGSWLGGLAPWDFFSTWTFSKPVSLDGAMYFSRRHMKWLRKTAGQPIHAFVAAERGERGGLIHLHALLGNVASHIQPYCGLRYDAGTWGRECCMVHAWPAGYARVLRYDAQKGAAYYVSKYVSKQLAEWELVGFPLPQKLSHREGERCILDPAIH